ncbi:MAG: dTDP-4-dehydrorhamnose reductase [Verrucomicrobia bacterium]|nr:dTDP-4-dehydrorhamnose reductase [Verrucomicrobiota bacterium]
MRERIAIIGRNGRLGAALCRELAIHYEVLPLGREEVDLRRPIEPQMKDIGFELLINAAAATNVDWCESHQEEANLINGEAVAALAELCAIRRVRMLHIGTDYVFDGSATAPYEESDLANPISVYGSSKLIGEQSLLRASDQHLAIRVSWVFGPDKASFLDFMLHRAQFESEVCAVADKFSAPTYTHDFCEWIRPLLFDLPAGGVMHLCNDQGCSWQEYAQCGIDTARRLGWNLKCTIVKPIALNSMSQFVAKRPVYTVLSTKRFFQMTGIHPRKWDEAVDEYVRAKLSAGS